jgi:hypothetical protein
MPTSWADLECSESALSTRFWAATARQREAFADLGFTGIGFKKLRRILSQLHRDDGGINYLDGSRCHFGQIIYHRLFVPAPVRADREHITIAFTAVFERGSLSYSNSKSPFDPLPHHEVVRCSTPDVSQLYSKFVEHLNGRPQPPRHFADDQSLRRWFDANQVEVFEAKVRRRLILRMTDAEVETAQRRLPPPLP